MNMDWTRHWLDGCFNKRDLEGMRKLYDPQVRFSDMPMGITGTGWELVGQFLGAFFEPASGEHRFVPKSYLGSGHEGVAEWTWEGRMGEQDLFQIGQSTPGKTFSVPGCSVFRFGSDGLVVEERDYWDIETVRRQLRDA